MIKIISIKQQIKSVSDNSMMRFYVVTYFRLSIIILQVVLIDCWYTYNNLFYVFILSAYKPNGLLALLS